MDRVEQPVAGYTGIWPPLMSGEILIEGDCGDGAYAPTIMLIVPRVAGVKLLVSIFDRLSSAADGFSICLGDEPGVLLSASLLELTLVVVADVRVQHLSRDVEGGFKWVGTSDEWHTLSLLTAPLVRRPGHQYLTSEGVDDALIEVSHAEKLGRRSSGLDQF